MKKRLIATLLVGAVAATGVIGLSACGVSVPSGEEVTKQVWGNAFDKATELTNYTMNTSGSVQATVKGTVSQRDYSTSKVEKKDVEVKLKTTETETVLFDQDNKYYYRETSSTIDMERTYDGEKTNSSEKSTAKHYYEFSEKDKTTSTELYWHASYSSSESKSDKEHSVKESYWDANETTSFPSNNVDGDFITQLFYNSDEENDKQESGYITEIYDWFTYSSGKYTATLYVKYSIPGVGIREYVACDVTISIKDGCAVGASVKIDTTGNAYEKEAYDLEYTIKGESVYSITNVKSTDPSKKATGDITKALDKAKADKEKEENK